MAVSPRLAKAFNLGRRSEFVTPPLNSSLPGNSSGNPYGRKAHHGTDPVKPAVMNMVGSALWCATQRLTQAVVERELTARELSANRLALDIGVASGRITEDLNGRRSITADTAVRLGRYFGNSAQFWLDLQGQFDIAMVERERGAEIA